MLYEFILKEKTPGSSWEQIGRIAVKEEYYQEQYDSYIKYCEKRKKRYCYNDYLLLINQLTDDGEFISSVI